MKKSLFHFCRKYRQMHKVCFVFKNAMSARHIIVLREEALHIKNIWPSTAEMSKIMERMMSYAKASTRHKTFGSRARKFVKCAKHCTFLCGHTSSARSIMPPCVEVYHQRDFVFLIRKYTTCTTHVVFQHEHVQSALDIAFSHDSSQGARNICFCCTKVQ